MYDLDLEENEEIKVLDDEAQVIIDNVKNSIKIATKIVKLKICHFDILVLPIVLFSASST